MTGRERVLAAFDFRQSDKIPLDINSQFSSGINAYAYRDLRNYLDLPRKPLYIYDFEQQLAIVEKDVLDFFDADIVQLGCDTRIINKYRDKEKYWKRWLLEDGAPCEIPLEKNDYMSMYEKINNPNEIKIFRETAAATRDSTDRAVYWDFGGGLAQEGFAFFKMENFLHDLLADPDNMQTFLDSVTEKHLTNLKTYLAASGKYIDIIGFNDDMGSQSAPFFSPEIYQKFFYPRHKMMWSYIHENFPGIKICLHSCGALRPLLPLFIKAGLDAINPVQYTCKDMALKDIKNEFGKKLVFWGGGCDPNLMLPESKAEDIRSSVIENISILRNSGGFIFQPVHNILRGMSAENIVTMYKTAREYSF
ncbi:MAG: methyltransferase [Treponema sp.]|nr:methyltransferase [Treponema sp.]